MFNFVGGVKLGIIVNDAERKFAADSRAFDR